MIRAFGNSLRIAMIASMPPISGICRSINVTSGRCFWNSFIASIPVDASAINSMSGSAFTSAAMPLRRSPWSSTVRTRIGAESIGMSSHLFVEQPECARFIGFDVRDGGGDDQLDFRARPGFTPEIQPRANLFCAFADPRQAPMSGARALLQYFPVNADSIVANPQAKLATVESDLGFDPLRLRVPESVSQDLAGDAVDLVLKDWRQASRWSFHRHAEEGAAAARILRFCEFPPCDSEQLRQIAPNGRRRAQVLYGVAAFGDCRHGAL